MKKVIAVGLAFLLLLTMASCANETTLLDEPRIYETASEIRSLEIEITAADFSMEQSDRFRVESNLKDLSVSEGNGILTIKDNRKHGVHGTDYSDAILKLYVPEGTVFESVVIETGAGRLTADTLSANSLKLKLGAGQAVFGCLNASSDADLEGGAGEIRILSGTLRNLELSLGVGNLDMTARLLGDSHLECGIGESDLTLIGSKDDYRVSIEKGIGSISVDGVDASDFGSSGNGQNSITVEGGIGAVNIVFQAEN